MNFVRSAAALVAIALFMSPFDASASYTGEKNEQPNLLSLGAGVYDFRDSEHQVEAVDLRLEHRWGMSLLPMVDSYFERWNSWFQIHPFAGIETSSRAQFYGMGGFVFDMFLGRNIVLSPNLAVGLYYMGDGKRLGSFVEFRSTFEAGWRFDNGVRVTGYIGHMSNAGLTDYNRGSEQIGAYLHIPTTMLFD